MPIFEYECRNCGHVSTFLESADKSKQAHECAECGSRDTAKLFSTFAARMGTSGSGGPSCDFGCDSAGSSCPTGTCPYA